MLGPLQTQTSISANHSQAFAEAVAYKTRLLKNSCSQGNDIQVQARPSEKLEGNGI
jgi:hypothetical protein